jgi:hypothetical protein
LGFKKTLIGALTFSILIVLTLAYFRIFTEKRQMSDINSMYTMITQIQTGELNSTDVFRKMLNFNDATKEGLAEILLESAYISKAFKEDIDPPNDLPQTKVPKDGLIKGLRGYSRSRLALWRGNSSATLENLSAVKANKSSKAILFDAASLVESLADKRPFRIPEGSQTPEIFKRISAYMQAK